MLSGMMTAGIPGKPLNPVSFPAFPGSDPV